MSAVGLRCGHVICRVAQIGAAVRDFADLGFAVEWGGDPASAHNALVWFARGPFIELLEPPPPAGLARLTAGYGEIAGARVRRWARAAEGWCDVALEADGSSLADARSALLAAGVEVSPAIAGERIRPDGALVRYQFLAPRAGGLPFVVSAYDPPQRPERPTHPNGASEVARVRLGVAPGDRALLDAMASGDRWLRPEPAAGTGVLDVELRGLRATLDARLLHGAVLLPASRRP